MPWVIGILMSRCLRDARCCANSFWTELWKHLFGSCNRSIWDRGKGKRKHFLDYFLHSLVAQQNPKVSSEFPDFMFSPSRILPLPGLESRLSPALPLHWANSLEVVPKEISPPHRETGREGRRTKGRFDRGLLSLIFFLELMILRAICLQNDYKNGLGRSA